MIYSIMEQPYILLTLLGIYLLLKYIIIYKLLYKFVNEEIIYEYYDNTYVETTLGSKAPGKTKKKLGKMEILMQNQF